MRLNRGRDFLKLILILQLCISVVSFADSTYSPIDSYSYQQDTIKFVPGDAIRILLPLDSASFLNGTYPIDDNGNIFLPIIGDYNICRSSIRETVAFLRKTYEPYIRFPEIQITSLMRISLLGGFAKPGMYYVEPQRSIWDVVSNAGGTRDEKGLNKMRWERDRKIIQKDLIPLIESGRSLKAIGFQSGDQIWTPSENRKFIDVLIREVLPIATFFLSLYVGINTIDRNN